MELEDLRKQIDELDCELLEVISRRLALMPMVADVKREQNASVNQEERERELMANMRKMAQEREMSPDFVERIMREIIAESKRIQERSM
ncbi:MAG: chorismate mutase [Candidatus Aenigmarchaeota archaeon]|nr:chorismate mutase [Candidatus Aenigmarchaeota archaeon]